MSPPDPRGGLSKEPGALLTTGEMARRTNNTLRTVRFYEEEGILRPLRRTEGGHRLFDPHEIDRLTLVTDLRAAGLSLDEIKHLLELRLRALNGGDAARTATDNLARRIAELREKLGVLTRLQEDLSQTSDAIKPCLDCDDGSFPRGCDGCRVMTQPSLPRSMRVLWSAQNGRAGGGTEP